MEEGIRGIDDVGAPARAGGRFIRPRALFVVLLTIARAVDGATAPSENKREEEQERKLLVTVGAESVQKQIGSKEHEEENTERAGRWSSVLSFRSAGQYRCC